MRIRKIKWVALIALPLVVNGGIYLFSRNTTNRNWEFPTQMQYTVAYPSQSPNPVLPNGMTLQAPVAGTIPRGYLPFHYGSGTEEAARAGRELKNPFEPTPENLSRGQQVFANFCAVCHGQTGAGDGPIIPKYPNPPSYKTDQSRNIPDGTLFHIVTMGRKNMPPHASQLSAEDRWKVVLYIRKLQGK